MELMKFQIQASEQIAGRYSEYMKEPLPGLGGKFVPFYQNLSAITGAGKTLILADCIEQIRAYSTTQPVVLWLSRERDLLDDTKGLLLIATVGKINQKDKADGDRRVFQTGIDNANNSLWEMLKIRKNYSGIISDLIIVYDEGHNLSDQQTRLLLDLNPTALIAASATTKVPKELEWYIARLKKEKELKDSDLVTVVSNKQVVKSGLIKKFISIGGYMTPMEIAIHNLLNFPIRF